MTSDNFRSAYYQKIGFEGVQAASETIKSVLEDIHVDVERISGFCLRYDLPVEHRNDVWLYLLGVKPALKPSQAFVTSSMRGLYNDLLAAVATMYPGLTHSTYSRESILAALKVDATALDTAPSNATILARLHEHLAATARPSPEVFAHMYRIHSGSKASIPTLSEEVEGGVFRSIFRACMRQMEDRSDAFWLGSALLQLNHDLPDRILASSRMMSMLQREDNELWRHLHTHNVRASSPTLQLLYSSFFAVTLPHNLLIRIWDKVMGGTIIFLEFAGLSFLLNRRTEILALATTQQLESLLLSPMELPEKTCNDIFTLALTLWRERGSPLRLKPGS